MGHPVHRAIWNKFRIKRGDTLPFNAWTGSRNELAELFAELGFKRGAEIGVCKGHYSAYLCKVNPGLKLKCIDPWVGFSRSTNQAKADRNYRKAVEMLKPYDVEIIRKTSVDACKDVPDGSLDFVYIDALHDFDHVMMDLIIWTSKVRIGGIVAGHDYYPAYEFAVIQAVDTYTRVHNINLYYLTAEKQFGSFFWVRD